MCPKKKKCLFIHFQFRLFGKHCSKTDFQTHSFKITSGLFLNNKTRVLSGNWVIILKMVRAHLGQLCLISSSHNYPKVFARQIPKSTWSAFFKNQTQIPNTYFCFLNTETCYLNYDTKHIFFIF